jgi:hypothetical protein
MWPLIFYLISRLQNPSIASNVDEGNRRIRNAFYGQSSFDYKDLLNLNLGLTEDASSSIKSIIYPSIEIGFKWHELK